MATGEPPPEITWYRNGEPVETSSMNPSSNHLMLPSGQLFFLRVIHNKNNKPDVGTYYCKATNPETRVSVTSRNATLEIAGTSKFVSVVRVGLKRALGALQVLCNAFLCKFDTRPPPSNANNVRPYTFVMLFSGNFTHPSPQF